MEAALGNHDKHVFVFSTAGKPIYSYHGNEESLSELMATAQALISVALSKGESLRYMRSGKYVIAFLDRSPLCLVAVSSLAEPPAVLRMQLAMVHGQVTSLLTASAMAAVFTKSPGFDARRLLGGADVMLDSLISGFSADPSALLGAYPTLALMRGVRTAVLQSLRHAMQASGSLFGLMLGAGCVVASAAAGRQPLQQWDVLLLLNFLNSNESLKQAETITPLCLPSYNANGHLHAYINYLDPTTGAAIVLLAGSRTSDFHSMSAARQGLVDALATNGALQSVLDACKAHGSAETMASVKSVERVLTNASLSPDALLHFAYKLTRPQQFVMSSFSSCSDALRQDIVVAYSQLRAGMFDHAGEHVIGPLQTFRCEVRKEFVVVALSGAEAELYATFNPLVSKVEAARVGTDLLKTLQSRHNELFFPP